MEKLSKFILTFVCFNLFITLTWYIIELVTLKEIQESSEDTIICIILSLLLSMVVHNAKVKRFLNNEKCKEKRSHRT